MSAIASRRHRHVWPVVVLVSMVVLGACVLAAVQSGGGVRSGVVLLAGLVGAGIAAVLTYAVASPLPAEGGAGRSTSHFIGGFGGGGDCGSGGDCG